MAVARTVVTPPVALNAMEVGQWQDVFEQHVVSPPAHAIASPRRDGAHQTYSRAITTPWMLGAVLRDLGFCPQPEELFGWFASFRRPEGWMEFTDFLRLMKQLNDALMVAPADMMEATAQQEIAAAWVALGGDPDQSGFVDFGAIQKVADELQLDVSIPILGNNWSHPVDFRGFKRMFRSSAVDAIASIALRAATILRRRSFKDSPRTEKVPPNNSNKQGGNDPTATSGGSTATAQTKASQSSRTSPRKSTPSDVKFTEPKPKVEADEMSLTMATMNARLARLRMGPLFELDPEQWEAVQEVLGEGAPPHPPPFTESLDSAPPMESPPPAAQDTDPLPWVSSFDSNPGGSPFLSPEPPKAGRQHPFHRWKDPHRKPKSRKPELIPKVPGAPLPTLPAPRPTTFNDELAARAAAIRNASAPFYYQKWNVAPTQQSNPVSVAVPRQTKAARHRRQPSWQPVAQSIPAILPHKAKGIPHESNRRRFASANPYLHEVLQQVDHHKRDLHAQHESRQRLIAQERERYNHLSVQAGHPLPNYLRGVDKAPTTGMGGIGKPTTGVEIVNADAQPEEDDVPLAVSLKRRRMQQTALAKLIKGQTVTETEKQRAMGIFSSSLHDLRATQSPPTDTAPTDIHPPHEEGDDEGSLHTSGSSGEEELYADESYTDEDGESYYTGSTQSDSPVGSPKLARMGSDGSVSVDSVDSMGLSRLSTPPGLDIEEDPGLTRSGSDVVPDRYIQQKMFPFQRATKASTKRVVQAKDTKKSARLQVPADHRERRVSFWRTLRDDAPPPEGTSARRGDGLIPQPPQSEAADSSGPSTSSSTSGGTRVAGSLPVYIDWEKRKQVLGEERVKTFTLEPS